SRSEPTSARFSVWTCLTTSPRWEASRPVRLETVSKSSVLLAENVARRTAEIGAVIPPHFQRIAPLESRLFPAHRAPSAPRLQGDSRPGTLPVGARPGSPTPRSAGRESPVG